VAKAIPDANIWVLMVVGGWLSVEGGRRGDKEGKKNWRMKNVQKENKKEKKYLICNATSECTHLNVRNVI
jgi:hypothetical protein